MLSVASRVGGKLEGSEFTMDNTTRRDSWEAAGGRFTREIDSLEHRPPYHTKPPEVTPGRLTSRPGLFPFLREGEAGVMKGSYGTFLFRASCRCCFVATATESPEREVRQPRSGGSS